MITSVNPPTQQVKTLCYLSGWHTVVVADLKTPKTWNVPSRGSQNCSQFASNLLSLCCNLRAVTVLQIRRQFRMSPDSLVDRPSIIIGASPQFEE